MSWLTFILGAWALGMGIVGTEIRTKPPEVLISFGIMAIGAALMIAALALRGAA